MQREIIISTEYIMVFKEDKDIYMTSFKKGLVMDAFNTLLEGHPEIRLTSFMAINNCLNLAPHPAVKIGELKNRVEVDISGDELKAFITLYVSPEELIGEKRTQLIKEIIFKLKENEVVFGVKRDVLYSELCIAKKILVAEGVAPVNGNDSEIKYYQLREIKPRIVEDGKADYYELDLINVVKKDEWLGERKDSTPGVEGKSVKGRIIPAMPGKKYPLVYEKKSVCEKYENGVTTLFSLFPGAVHFTNDAIGVSNYLEITNDVGVKTGNLDFDGFLTVKGSVEDNYVIEASMDIEILGNYGIGSVKGVESKKGNIYIKGGIAGKNKAVLRSKKDVYTKFISDATIICEGTVHIGFYCINSNIRAKEVILDSPRGQIIGGTIEAEVLISAAILGSAADKRTIINVLGFDRNELKNRLDSIVGTIQSFGNELARIKQEIDLYSNLKTMGERELKELNKLNENLSKARVDIKEAEDERTRILRYLKVKGEGEISISKKIYANTVIHIRGVTKEFSCENGGKVLYYSEGELKES